MVMPKARMRRQRSPNGSEDRDSMTTSQRAILELARAMRDRTGNLPLLPGIYPNYQAPIVRNGADAQRELVMARWGMPSSAGAQFEATKKRAEKLRDKGKSVDFKELLRMEPDSGVTNSNIRNTKSKHWRTWLEIEHRCVVPSRLGLLALTLRLCENAA
jgi:putative SOS response-associated peptidase YedK